MKLDKVRARGKGLRIIGALSNILQVFLRLRCEVRVML